VGVVECQSGLALPTPRIPWITPRAASGANSAPNSATKCWSSASRASKPSRDAWSLVSDGKGKGKGMGDGGEWMASTPYRSLFHNVALRIGSPPNQLHCGYAKTNQPRQADPSLSTSS
jgi:hypothetical protein